MSKAADVDDVLAEPEIERDPVFRSWQRMMRLAKPEVKLAALGVAAKEAAGLWRKGLRPKRQAIDEMMLLVEGYDLLMDDVQMVIADAFQAREQQYERGEAKPNGHDGRKGLPFILFDQIELVPKQWLAQDFLGAGETSCWYGHPGGGKSVLIEDFGLHVAAAMMWHDRDVKQGAVLYIALERMQLVKRRALAFKIKHNAHGLPFAIMGGVLDFRDQKTADAILQTVAEIEKVTGQKVVLIIVDTISRALCGGDENSPKDMGALVNTVGRVQAATGAHVALVHHVPHEAERMRGHGSLLGAIDTTVHVVKGNDARSGTIIKDNDGADGQAVNFTLESVDLCSVDDVMTTSPVVVPCSAEDAATRSANKMGNAAKLALRLLHDALAEAGTIPPASNHIPPNSRTCGVATWRSYCYAGTITESDNPDSKQKAFVRSSKTLQSLGLIGVWNDQVWLTGQAGHGRT